MNKQTLSCLSGIFFWVTMPLAFSQAIPPVAAAAALHFNDLTEVYRYIVQTRGLGRPNDEALVRALISGSTVEQVPDKSGNTLTVIKANLVADGTSRLASAEGNLPYYVLRQQPGGLSLIGMMFGESYTFSVTDGHVQFKVQLRMSAGRVHDMRFEVRGEALVNMSPLKGAQHAPFIA
jgi:hypothetical protein